MASGGYRQPSNPAPVSGPGALSKRTDGGPGAKQPVRVPTGGSYGDATQLMQMQQQAPLAASPGGDSASPLGLPAQSATPFGAPTEQPDTPVTDGAAVGAGAGVDALGITPDRDDDLQRLIAYMPVLEHMANQPGSSKSSRNLVRMLKGMQ
jgi:hypothetical protein